jgi:hypothetical protein
MEQGEAKRAACKAETAAHSKRDRVCHAPAKLFG